MVMNDNDTVVYDLLLKHGLISSNMNENKCPKCAYAPILRWFNYCPMCVYKFSK